MAKPYKIKKPKEKKQSKAANAKPWWFIVAAIPVVLLVVVLLYQFKIIGGERQQQHEARVAMLSDGGFEAFDTLGVDVYMPSNAKEETPQNGASYSKLKVQRDANGNPLYAFGVIAIPNESNKPYDINKNFDEILNLSETSMGNMIADVYGGLHPSFMATINRRTLFDGVDAIETYGTCSVNISYLGIDQSEDAVDKSTIVYREDPYQMKYYSDVIVINNRPVVAWSFWNYAVPVGDVNARQAVVDALASMLGVDTQDTSGESLEAIGSSETALVYRDDKWYNDVTGELVESIPSVDDPNFVEKYMEYIDSIRGEQPGASLNDLHEHEHDDASEGDSSQGEGDTSTTSEGNSSADSSGSADSSSAG